MKVSYNWLKEYIDGDLPPVENIVDALTMHSFEIEGVEVVGDDKILDVKILPNRSHDCLSHYGIASEIVSVLGEAHGLSRKNIDEIVDIPTLSGFKVVIEDKKLCTRMFAILIRNVQVTESPEWLVSRLKLMGQRPINNVVDVTNYITYALGQPMHAFDFDTIEGNSIIIRRAKKGEKITLLNDKTYSLDTDMVVIADEKKALDVAGIMGGTHTATYEHTKNILLVVDNFDPVSIRMTAKKLGLRTDASHRFENGISSTLVDRALAPTLTLITELTGGSIEGGIDAYPNRDVQKIIFVSAAKISSILGVEVDSARIVNLLGRQGIQTQEKDGRIEVQVPLARLDLALQEDVAEEVGRLYGYENIAPIPLPAATKPQVNRIQYASTLTRQALVALEFSEIYTYAFTSDGSVEVENPIASDKKFLRQDLSAAMSVSLEQNFKFLDLLGKTDVKLFEIGTVFSAKGETLHLSLGVKLPKSKKTDVADEEIARAIHAVEDALGVSVGDVSIVGGLAEINFSRMLEDIALPETYPDNFWINGGADIAHRSDIVYKSISPYPFAVRDVAVFVPIDISAEAVEALIRPHFTPIVVRVGLFDTFTKALPDAEGALQSKVSYAFRLVFQSSEKTLTDEEINAVMNPIYETLKSQDGFEIR